MATSAILKLNDELEEKLFKFRKDNNISSLPKAVNAILKDYFKTDKDFDELLTKEEVAEVFNACLKNVSK